MKKDTDQILIYGIESKHIFTDSSQQNLTLYLNFATKSCILGFVPLFTNGQKKLHKGRKSNLSKSLTHFSHYRSNFYSCFEH